MLAPEAFALPLPEGMADIAVAPLLCAGIIGYRALRLSEVRPGETLGLYGFSTSAHLCIQIARARGCTVYVFTRTPEHAALARELGAAWTGEAREAPPRRSSGRSSSHPPAGWSRKRCACWIAAARSRWRGST